MRRFWTYDTDDWDPEHPLLPYFGHDEFGRLTVVLRVSPRKYLVWAYRKCRDRDCVPLREETAS